MGVVHELLKETIDQDFIKSLTVKDCGLLIAELDKTIQEAAFYTFVQKASEDPTTFNGFVALEQLLAESMTKKTAKHRKWGEKELNKILKDVNLDKLTETERIKLLGMVSNLYTSFGIRAAESVQPMLFKSTQSMFRNNAKIISQEFDLDMAFGVKDKKAMQSFSETQGLWIRDHFKNDYTKRLNKYTLKDLEELGGNRKILAEKLHAEFGDRVLGHNANRAYWEVVSSANLNHARSYSSVRTFQEAGVEHYQIVAVRDERTTTVCKEMDGRVFEVSVSAKLLSRVNTAKTPDEFKEMKPWVSVKMGEDGDPVYTAGSFTFTKDVSGEDLAKHNVTIPPFHGRCRSRVIAEFIQKSLFTFSTCR